MGVQGIFRFAFAFLILAWGGNNPLAAQQLQVRFVPGQAWQGQPVNYEVAVFVRGRGKPKEASCQAPVAEGLSFTLVSSGAPNGTVMVNGYFQVWRFVYQVTANRAGSFRVPGPVVTLDGKAVRGRAASLRVLAPPKQDAVFISLRAIPEIVVPGQEVELVCDVEMKLLPKELNTSDPLSVYGRGSFFDRNPKPPKLSLPWVKKELPGLGRVPILPWLEARLVQSGLGFQIPAGGGGRFMPKAAATRVHRQSGGRAQSYNRYRFAIKLRAQSVGSYELEPATFLGPIVEDRGGGRRRGRFGFREVFARSEPLKVIVTDLPSEGRPKSFGGAVGRFRFSMQEPSPTTLSEGNPVYMTFVASGEGLLKGVTLNLAEQLGDRFRVEALAVTDSKAKGESLPPGFPKRAGKWRQFDFKVYPLGTGAVEIPPIAFSWYDPGAKSWEEARTKAVSLTVKPKAAGNGNVVVAAGSSGSSDVELVATSTLSRNIVDLNLLGNQAPNPWPWWMAMAALPLLYLAVALLLGRRRRLHGDPALLRRRKAHGRAQQRFDAARRKTSQDPMAALAESQQALRGLAADLSNRDEEALTGAELLRWVQGTLESEALTAEVARLNDAVEACLFGGGAPAADKVEEILGGVSGVLDAAKKAGQSGKGRALGLLLALCLLAPGVKAQDIESFQRAQAAFKTGHPQEAAELFQAMLSNGYENGYVLYNLGNCYLRQGKLGEAIAAYRRASLYLPADANLALNLRRALDARKDPLSLPEKRAFSDYILFWRPRLAMESELKIGLALALLAFVFAMLRLLLNRSLPALKWSARFLGFLALLFAVSALLDYRELEARDRGAVTVSETMVRSGPGESFEPSYEQSVGQGAEFEVLARDGDWLRVRIAGRYVGWIPANHAALW